MCCNAKTITSVTAAARASNEVNHKVGKLHGVKAVQTLSRLNRIHPGNAGTSVLDFVNTAEQMREEFAPFFQTTWTEETDPNLLYNLQARIIAHAVIDPAEQKTAVQAFLTATGKPKGAAHAAMWSAINPAVARFGTLHQDDQHDFRDALTAYTRAYAFLGQVMGFADPDLESLFYYGEAAGRSARARQGRPGQDRPRGHRAAVPRPRGRDRGQRQPHPRQ